MKWHERDGFVPRKCARCGGPIPVGDSKPREYNERQYCSQDCRWDREGVGDECAVVNFADYDSPARAWQPTLRDLAEMVISDRAASDDFADDRAWDRHLSAEIGLSDRPDVAQCLRVLSESEVPPHVVEKAARMSSRGSKELRRVAT
jgi:hypothetical protein